MLHIWRKTGELAWYRGVLFQPRDEQQRACRILRTLGFHYRGVQWEGGCCGWGQYYYSKLVYNIISITTPCFHCTPLWWILRLLFQRRDEKQRARKLLQIIISTLRILTIIIIIGLLIAVVISMSSSTISSISSICICIIIIIISSSRTISNI